jgi:DNA primase
MKIDVIQLLEDNDIEYWDSGKNCQKGWINIQCPMCNDHSNHGGFNLESSTTYYNCWECGWHSLYNVLSSLKINSKYKELLKEYRTSGIYEEKKVKRIRNTKIEVPGSKAITPLHSRYLKKRNFIDIEYLTMKYDLRYTTYYGAYKFRIIFPIYYKGRIISYQGRDVSDKQKLRYKACAKDKEIIEHKHVLYNIDNCKKSYIGIVEGLFDCIRFGDNFAATFGTSYTNEQLQLLKIYKKVYIIFDPEEAAQKRAEALSIELESMGIEVYNILLDNKEKDPAMLTEYEIFTIKKNLNIF